MNKVLIAMSGGVDSSVAAYLMLQTGNPCVGATMKLFDEAEPGPAGAAGAAPRSGKRCCSLPDVNDARDVAMRLGIPHYVLNFKPEFRERVIERFIRVYEEGGTPNPCIDCNRFIKFDALLRRAAALECDILATGHYARIEKAGERRLLKKGVDAAKDQSYFLYAMTQAQLAAAAFPLGTLTKSHVRGLARERGMITAAKGESQDICFVPDGDYGAFMEAYTGRAYPAGDILDNTGRILGRHRGHVRYTQGQRRGLGVGGGSQPLYVTAKSPAANTVTLGTDAELYTKTLYAGGLNLIALDRIDGALHVQAKIRYLHHEQPAVVHQLSPASIRVDFTEAQRAISPGQAVVLYDGDTVLGGATIQPPPV